jgi:hypothetical protein
MGAPNGSVVATPHEYLGSPVFMTHNAKIGDANGAGVRHLRPNLVTEEWTQTPHQRTAEGYHAARRQKNPKLRQ